MSASEKSNQAERPAKNVHEEVIELNRSSNSDSIDLNNKNVQQRIRVLELPSCTV